MSATVMSAIIRAYPDYPWWRRWVFGATSWWLILECGHWLRWTARRMPTETVIACPACSQQFAHGTFRPGITRVNS